MGTTLLMDIECRCEDSWEYVETDVSHPGGYAMMACLFGWRNYCNYDPIAGQRGLPDDVSDKLSQFDPLSCSWIGLWEIERIDWSETAEEIDSRTSFYDSEGNYVTKIGGFSLPVETEDEEYMSRVWEGEEVTVTLTEDHFEFDAGDEVTLVRELRDREYAMNEAWKEIFDTMRKLADEHGGEENVRLVVAASG
ncbi:hypothetical protein OB955_17470 [Halobacteria archaeon AArc-m2/3/4]|uniref:Uncharacterized protein n=1 Tax=Natronoglomus mannanivorans TaxID=2979990 RepID=A0ABT2QHW7_9EURY|nr:hypothetical protein [Halobacteria archaeon AArc-m2/3/4]